MTEPALQNATVPRLRHPLIDPRADTRWWSTTLCSGTACRAPGEAWRRRGVAAKPRVAVPLALLGARLRANGRQAATLRALLAPHVALVALGPEVTLGLTPLEADQAPCATPLAERLGALAAARARTLVRRGIAGYVARPRQGPCRGGVDGAFTAGPDRLAHTLLAALPSLPVVEADQLRNAIVRTTFLRRVRAYHHLLDR